jgi:hypothetical protein
MEHAGILEDSTMRRGSIIGFIIFALGILSVAEVVDKGAATFQLPKPQTTTVVHLLCRQSSCL